MDKIMKWFIEWLKSSLGRKLVLSTTGLFLIVFLLSHAIGNAILFTYDASLFNAYAEFMSTSPLIRVMEIVLFAAFIVHIAQAILITRANRKARGQSYAKYNGSANSNMFARNMIHTGMVVFIFLIIHLKSFFFERVIGDVDMFDLVKTSFESEGYVIFYVIAMIVLGFHLVHAFQSAFQTLGIHHSKYSPLITKVGYLIGIIIPSIFAFMPIYFYFELYKYVL